MSTGRENDDAGQCSGAEPKYEVHAGFVHAFENATFIVDHELKVQRANSAAAALLGCASAADAIGVDGTMLVRAEDRRQMSDQVHEARGARDFAALEVALETGGAPSTAELRVVPLTRDGEVDAYVLTMLSARSSSPAWLRLLETMRDGLFDADLVTGRVALSQSFLRLLGYEGAAGRLGTVSALRALIHPDDVGRARDEVNRTVHGDEVCATMRLLTGQGIFRWFEVRSVLQRDGAGTPIRAMGFLRDVTQLHQQEIVLHQLGRIAKVVAWIYDVSQDEFNFLTPVSTPGDWTNADLEAALRAPEGQLDPESARQWRTAFDLAVTHGQEWNVTMTFVDKSGRRRWLHTIGLAETQADQPVRLYGVVQETTSTRELQDQLLQSQKMEAIGQLAGGIAHDFNNVLAAVNGYKYLIAQTLTEDHAAHGHLDELSSAVESGAGLVRQLLALSRKQPVHPTSLDPNEVIRSMFTLLRRTMGSDIDIRVLARTPIKKVLIDRTQLEQVLLNLAINARDAMPNGGTLTFIVRSVTARGVVPVGKSAIQSTDHVEIVVRDTGVGMDATMLSQIFELFFTTKDPARGTGLGLPTSLGIIERAGGFIDVSSRPGAGTSFRICLPAVPEV